VKISKILFMAICGLMILVPSVLAADITVGDLLTVGWAENHSSRGGEFIISPSGTSDFLTFNTFCVETSESISPNGVTHYRVGGIGSVTVNQGMPLTEEVAYLYYHFSKGDLAGYDSASDQQALQDAIWFFMGLKLNVDNSFVDDALANAEADNFYGVRILNLVNARTGAPAQDVLFIPVPDGGLTVMLLGIGMGGLALLSRRFRG